MTPSRSSWSHALDSLPPWAKLALALGPPSLLAAFYMAQDAGVLPSLRKEQGIEIRKLTSDFEEHRKRQEAIGADVLRRLDDILCECRRR